MTVQCSEHIPSPEEVKRFVTAAGENDYVDAKGPCSWDDDATKFALGKDIVAFSNSEGGGAIVIGKVETSAGHFDFAGLSDSECKSFDTTKVAQWINSRFSPPIRLTCCPTVHNRMSIVTIVISEFDDKPSICTKDTGKRPDGKFELTKGTIYVRTDNAASAPLQTADEVSKLIGRAVVKQQEQLRTMVDSVLAGRSAKNVPTDIEHFDQQLITVQNDILVDPVDRQKGAWSFSIHPEAFEPKWDSFAGLRDVLERCSLPRRYFPREYSQPVPREWGLSDQCNGVWALTHQGLFYYRREYWENSTLWKSPPIVGEVEKTVPGGEWIDIDVSVRRVIDFLAFARRFSELLDPAMQIRFQIEASQLSGRYLLRYNADLDLTRLGFPPCAAKNFRSSRTVPAGQLVANWREICVDILKEFVNLFPGGHDHIHRTTLEKLVDGQVGDVN